MHGRFCFRLLAATLLIGAIASALRAEDAKPSWACLPEDTVGLLRIPSGNKAADALKTKTRLGALLFDPQRIAKVREAMAKEGSDDFEEAAKELKKYDLKLEDVYKLLEGEAGLGVVLPAGDPRMVAILGWLEPDEDLATRLEAALDKLLEEHQDDSDLIKRKDIELASQKVIQLTITPPNVEEDDIEAKPGEARIRIREFKAPKFDVLLTRRGARLLIAGGVSPARGEAAEEAVRERLKDVFARFLVAHEDQDAGPKLRYLEATGVASALPGGLPLVEMMIDFRQLVKLLEMPEAKQAKVIIKACGLDQLGLLAYRLTFEKSLMRSGGFLGAPSPRSGLLALLDQETMKGQPPAWVPAEVINFGQFSMDLGKAYSRIKQIIIDQGGDSARNNFDLAETQVNQVLQTDIATLLSALGSQHSSVDLPPRKTDVAMGPEGLAGLTGSNVFVWKLTDEALWKRVIQTAAVLAQKEMVEEQGFQGIRIDQGRVRLGVFVGRGHLVAGGGGSDTLETVLSNLRNPPTGQASLAGSPLLQRAHELLPPRPCLGYSITDANRYAKTIRGALVAFTELAAGEEDSDRAVVELIRSLIPTEEEMNGVLGVGAAQTWVDEHGITGRSVGELPAP